jgi:hypothetical protein
MFRLFSSFSKVVEFLVYFRIFHSIEISEIISAKTDSKIPCPNIIGQFSGREYD